MFNPNDVITDGVATATVKYSSETFVVAEAASGEFALSADQLDAWMLASEATPAFSVLHPHVVYRLDGTRVDGYADRDRAIRRGKKFCPKGYVIVDANTGDSERFAS